MTTDDLIAVELFCTHQGVETTFVHALHERGLITITVASERHLIASADLPRIEQLARMHYDLDINLEGIEAISHLLERMQVLQDRLRSMDERLRMFDLEANVPE